MTERTWEHEVADRAGVDQEKLPRGRTFWWFGEQGPKVFDLRKPSPLNAGMTVAEMFQDDRSCRVYELPNSGPTEQERANPDTLRVARRLTLSKSDPTLFVEVMSLETFIQQLADEWLALAEGCTTREKERDRAVEYLEGEMGGLDELLVDMAVDDKVRQSVLEYMAETIEEVRRGEHMQDEGEPAEPPPAQNGVGATAGPQQS